MVNKEEIKKLAKEAVEHYYKYSSLIEEIRLKLSDEGHIVLPEEKMYSYSTRGNGNRNMFPKEIYCENEEYKLRCGSHYNTFIKEVLKFKDVLGDVHTEESIERPYYEPNREFIEMLAEVL